MTPAQINAANRVFWARQSVKDLQRWKREAGSRRGGLLGGLRRGAVNMARDAKICAAYAAGVVPKSIAADPTIFPNVLTSTTLEAHARRLKIVYRVIEKWRRALAPR